MSLAEVSLDDKYAKKSGRICLTGIQALVRLPILHRCAELGRLHVHRGQVRFPDLPRF